MTRIQSMQQCIDQLPGRIGFFYQDMHAGECLQHQAELPLMAASVIKLPIMAEAFRQFESGLLDPDQLITIRQEDKLPSCGALTYLHTGLQVTLMDLVVLMIILSDNTATNLLIDLLGMENINQTINALGLKGTCLNRKLFQPELSRQGIENYVTAADMAHLLSGILNGTLISPKASARMLSILRDQRLNGKLPFHLHSRGIKMAHKTGEDDGITHDVGIILGEKPRIICFLSNETDVPKAEQAMQELAAIAAEDLP